MSVPTDESLAKAFHAFGGRITEDGPVVRAMQRIMFDARQLDERTTALRTKQAAGEAVALLREVAEWIDGWEPSFVDDDEWPPVAERIQAILAGSP